MYKTKKWFKMESLESFYFKAGFESVIKELQHYDFFVSR